MKTYNKLVRDRIPEIIEATGARCETRILSDAEYLLLLNAKLDEELTEYHQSGDIEELADMLEVIYALANAKGFTIENLNTIRTVKAQKRGHFHKKIMLLSVDEVRK